MKKSFSNLIKQNRASKLSLYKGKKNQEIFEKMLKRITNYCMYPNDQKEKLQLQVPMYLCIMGAYNFDHTPFNNLEFVYPAIEEFVNSTCENIGKRQVF